MNLKTIARNPFALTEAPTLQPQLKQFGAQLVMQFRAALNWVDESYTRQRLSKRLKVVETVSLGEKRFVSILQVDGSQFLIGGTAGSVSLLASMEPNQNPNREPRQEFADVLRLKAASEPGTSRAEE